MHKKCFVKKFPCFEQSDGERKRKKNRHEKVIQNISCKAIKTAIAIAIHWNLIQFFFCFSFSHGNIVGRGYDCNVCAHAVCLVQRFFWRTRRAMKTIQTNQLTGEREKKYCAVKIQFHIFFYSVLSSLF